MKASYKQILKQIKHIEEDLKNESENESNIIAGTKYTCNNIKSEIAVKLINEDMPFR